MTARPTLHPDELANLARVAQGQGALLGEADARRLIAAGLVLCMDVEQSGHPTLQLTAAGLALVHSSDQ